MKEAISRVLGFGDKDGTRLPLYGGFRGGEGEWQSWKEVIGAMTELENSLYMK